MQKNNSQSGLKSPQTKRFSLKFQEKNIINWILRRKCRQPNFFTMPLTFQPSPPRLHVPTPPRTCTSCSKLSYPTRRYRERRVLKVRPSARPDKEEKMTLKIKGIINCCRYPKREQVGFVLVKFVINFMTNVKLPNKISNKIYPQAQKIILRVLKTNEKNSGDKKIQA